MNQKLFRRLILFFLLVTMVFALFSCREKPFSEYKIHEIVESNRDGRVRKIDENFFLELHYHDSSAEVYWISSAEQTKDIAYSLNSPDNIFICKDCFEEYGQDEDHLYFLNSARETVTVVYKDSKQYETLSVSEFENFDAIIWHKV